MESAVESLRCKLNRAYSIRWDTSYTTLISKFPTDFRISFWQGASYDPTLRIRFAEDVPLGTVRLVNKRLLNSRNDTRANSHAHDNLRDTRDLDFKEPIEVELMSRLIMIEHFLYETMAGVAFRWN